MLDRIFAGSSSVAPLILRMGVGVVGIVHGWPKMKDLETFIANVDKLGVPLPQLFGTAAALSEFLGGIALVLGLFGRYAAFFFGCVMAVAVFKVHWASGFLAQNKGFEYPLTLLLASVSLVFSGSGPVSIDHLIGRKR